MFFCFFFFCFFCLDVVSALFFFSFFFGRGGGDLLRFTRLVRGILIGQILFSWTGFQGGWGVELVVHVIQHPLRRHTAFGVGCRW